MTWPYNPWGSPPPYGQQPLYIPFPVPEPKKEDIIAHIKGLDETKKQLRELLEDKKKDDKKNKGIPPVVGYFILGGMAFGPWLGLALYVYMKYNF